MQERKQYSEIKTNLEKTMYNINNTQRNNANNNQKKTILNLNNIINNLKSSLENFDSSIKELKSNIDKDKKEKEEKIRQLEETFNSKLNSLKNNQINIESAQKDKNKVEISPQIINEIISKLNFLEQKSGKFESDIYTKLEEFDNQNQIVFNQILQKINEKPENKYTSKTYKRNAESPLSKNIDLLVKQKIDECFDKKIEIIDEKILILNNKVINLEIKSQNKMYERNTGDSSIMKDNSFNEKIISDKIDKKIQELNNNVNNKLMKLAEKLGIEDLEDFELDDPNIIINDEKNNYIRDNDMNELEIKLMDEISNKFKMINDDLEDKINFIVDNRINDIINNEDINSKFSSLKSELSKMIDGKNNYFDNKIKILDNKINNCLMDNKSCLEKINSIETKLKAINDKIGIIDNKFENVNKDLNMNDIKLLTNDKILLTENSDYKNPNSNLSIGKPPIDKSFYLDSNIINKEYLTEDFFLFSKIKETFPYNMTINYKLIYRASKHGDSAKNFHSKCDYIGPNLVLVKTKKNFIFGGVTSKSWKHLLKDIKKDEPENGTEIKDDKAFGFSINLKKVYLNGKPNEFAIFCNNNYGPVFKNIYFKIFKKKKKKGGICGNIEESNFIGQEKDYEFNGGEEKFDVEDIEIFQIGFK